MITPEKNYRIPDVVIDEDEVGIGAGLERALLGQDAEQSGCRMYFNNRNFELTSSGDLFSSP